MATGEIISNDPTGDLVAFAADPLRLLALCIWREARGEDYAAKRGVAINGATAYITASPCWPCFKILANSGIKRIVFDEFYRDERIFDAAKAIGIELIKLGGQ